jgi:hypothetical protein
VDNTGTSTTDSETPARGKGFFYLVRGGNFCGEGSLGKKTNGEDQPGRACP